MADQNKRIGRPPAQNPRLRKLTVTLTDEEAAELQARARIVGTTAAELLRRGGVQRGDSAPAGSRRS